MRPVSCEALTLAGVFKNRLYTPFARQPSAPFTSLFTHAHPMLPAAFTGAGALPVLSPRRTPDTRLGVALSTGSPSAGRGERAAMEGR